VFYLLCLAILAVYYLTDKPLSEQQGLVCIHLKCYGDNHYHIIDMRRISIFKFDVLRMLEIFQHTLFPNALDGILHCCPCYIQQFATSVCLSNGVPIETVSSMLGHKDIKTTQVYAKITKEKLSKDVEKLSQQINNIEEFTFGNVCNDNTNTINGRV
jgi:hypothetical protein